MELENKKLFEKELKNKLKEHQDYLSKRIVLVASKNYTQLFPYFTRLLSKTRIPFLKRNGFWLGVLQMSMLRNLSRLQDDLRKFQTQLKSENLTQEDKKDLEHKVLIHQEWIRIFQTITDGIAWRVLNFNRPVIRLLSENQGPGPILPRYAKILTKFVSARSGVNLINDLTRCLRIGDLTCVTKDGTILLYEIKKNGRIITELSHIFEQAKKHGPASISRQRHRLLTAQMSIINGSIEIPLISDNGKVNVLHRAEIVNSNIPISAHFLAIRKLIKKTNETGFEQQELEEGYFIEITAWDKIGGSNSDSVAQRKKQALSGRPEWCKDKKSRVIDLSSVESFHREGTEYPRNFTPQSVLPFSSKNCVRLMMGCLEIKVFLNIDHLKKRLEKEGWQVQYTDINNSVTGTSKRPGTGPMEEFMNEVPNEDFLKLTKTDKDGTYHTVISATLIIFALSSCYKIDFLISAINAGFSRGRQGKFSKRNVAINFTREKEVLI